MENLYDAWLLWSGYPAWIKLLGKLGVSENDLTKLELIDDEFLHLAKIEKWKHKKWLRKNVPRNQFEAFKIFPEAKHLVKEIKTQIGRIIQEDIDLAKLVDVEDVVSEYVELEKSGASRLRGLCPFHSDKNPSLVLYIDTNSFYCFGCSTGGDVIAFLMKVENLTFRQAVKVLLRFSKINYKNYEQY